MIALPLFLALLPGPARAQQESPVAGGVVQSREWRVRRAPQKEEEFIGDVRYRRRSTVFSADWALFKHATQTWRARGHVVVDEKLSSGDHIRAKGDEAVYNQESQKGVLTAEDLVALTHAPASGEPDQGLAKRLEWEGKDKISLIGSVHTWGPRLETWSDRADYDDAVGALRLTGGRPVLHKLEGDWTGAVKADEITAFQPPGTGLGPTSGDVSRRVSADGATKGWLEFKQAPGERGPR